MITPISPGQPTGHIRGNAFVRASRLLEATDHDVHDLWRTWGTYLLEQGVIPSVVMSFGGWEDWDTFRKHYLGEFSPEAIRRERGKVDFLDGGDESAEVVHPGTLPATSHHTAD